MNFSLEARPAPKPGTDPKPETTPVPEQAPVIPKPEHAPDKALLESAFHFLGDQHELVDPSFIESATIRAEHKRADLDRTLRTDDPSKKAVSYDKYKKSFLVDGKSATMGTIVASRHWGTDITLSENLDQSGDGKKLRKTYLNKSAEDALSNELNYALAAKLAEQFEMRDMMKAEGFAGIRDRARQEHSENRMDGGFAEKVMIGAIEAISIDRPDLGITVTPANAYQDMEEKIDFVIHMKNKRRGAGVEELDPVETTLGIQFTMNTDRYKTELKHDQIKKAKERGLDVDDLVYVAIDKKMMTDARKAWKDDRYPINGPWHYLPERVKRETIKGFFQNLLTEEQIKGIRI